MALADVHRFTTDEFLAIEGLPRRVELLDGVIYDTSPEGFPHADPQSSVLRALMAALPNHRVLAGGSVRVTDRFCPIPDVAVYESSPDGAKTYPDGRDALLIVEVGVSTARRDRLQKLPAYAEGGVVEVWLVAPEAGRFTAFRQPQDGRYHDEVELGWPGGLDQAVSRLVARLGGSAAG